MPNHISRRQALLSTAAFASMSAAGARAQAPAAPGGSAAAPAAGANTNWTSMAADLAFTRYAPLDQINASNFNQLEVAWRLKGDNFGPRPDAYFSANATPLVVNGRLFTT